MLRMGPAGRAGTAGQQDRLDRQRRRGASERSEVGSRISSISFPGKGMRGEGSSAVSGQDSGSPERRRRRDTHTNHGNLFLLYGVWLRLGGAGLVSLAM
jgi:hypothetical protein